MISESDIKKWYRAISGIYELWLLMFIGPPCVFLLYFIFLCSSSLDSNFPFLCDINMNIISASDPGVCTYLDITFNCVPAIHSVTCEGSQANLQCGEGQVIVVSWANYGRRDNTTCPDGNPDHVKNVLCSSPNSTEYVTNRCNWQNNCTVGASNTVFGDPCGGTYKYLEVFYTCQGK
uniref:SUEL-type lectin domain-containing protein n=1 Tax=Astatotilapia calliptera TaxID=8154 RepID=A0A3P8PCB5_ASTCA